MRMPGLRDWTRNTEAAKAMLKDKLDMPEKKKKPWEEKMIKILSYFIIIVLVFYIIKYFVF